MQGQRRSLLVARIEDKRKSQDQREGGVTQGAWKPRRFPLHPSSLTELTKFLKPVDWVLYSFLPR